VKTGVYFQLVQVMERSLRSCDNCYNIANFRATGHVCKTNLPSNTAFRGFGAPQALMAIENVITDIAAFLHVSSHKVLDTVLLFYSHEQ